MNTIKAVFAGLAVAFSASAFSAGGDTQIELDRDRSSSEYKKEIFATLSKLENKKWSDGGADGYIIIHDTEPRKYNWNEPYYVDGVFVKVQRFHYGKLLKEYPGYVRQSPWNGYIEIYNEENRAQQLHIKMVGDDAFNLYHHTYESEERFTVKSVNEFNTNNPNPVKRSRSARESGTIF